MRKHLTSEIQLVSNKVFDDFRSASIEDFCGHRFIPFRRKISQGAFWTILEKDLANQYFRDEVWLFGVKISDQIKLIDHAADSEVSKSGMGFANKK